MSVPGRGEWPASRPRCFYHRGKRPLCPQIMRPGGPQRWSVCFGVGKILLRSCENVKLCKTAGCRGSDGDDYRLLGCDTLHMQGTVQDCLRWRWRQQVHHERWWISTGLCDITSKNTGICVLKYFIQGVHKAFICFGAVQVTNWFVGRCRVINLFFFMSVILHWLEVELLSQTLVHSLSGMSCKKNVQRGILIAGTDNLMYAPVQL